MIQRIAILIAVLSWAVLAVLMLNRADAQIKLDCADERTREQVRAVILEGIDLALRNQVVKVFDVWMRDTREDPPRKALIGMNIATNAYVRARANALAWNPPLCQP